MSYVEVVVTITALASVANAILQAKWYHDTRST